MSFEAIKSITEAETNAEQLIADAEVKARTLIADAETAGKLSLSDAANKAKLEKDNLFVLADENIKANDASEVDAAKSALDKLKASATSKIDEAAKLIAERIIKD